ncbi:YbaL family putative K(+) efflux transporter [Zavarzinia sp. CC-PAN008]|uniref:YbaL family putative K(+) efflux transporter n=1 Tax=Zavarzinia sp. CC-PAN008 TaxID=3243332 RepID=UPI003F74425D
MNGATAPGCKGRRMHYGPLIGTLVAGLVLAFIFGAIAHRLRLSPLVGYLLAGVVAGPFTPGFVADLNLASELAELGVILLMFGVGLHFSLKDLLAVRLIALPGAVVQIAVATAMGWGLALAMGWSTPEGLVFGLALSVASTVVLLRALQERRLVETDRGRIAVGWLIVEDLAMVLALVLLPAVAGALGTPAAEQVLEATQGEAAQILEREIGLVGPLLITLGKVAAFVALMLVFGRRIIPWILHWVAHTGSRELFRLAVLAIALGVAFGASTLFGVSFALGAFFAGMVLSESELSHRAAEETLPLRDAFAVLFFVSVGMLFDPAILLREPLAVLGTVAIIVLGKSAAAFAIVRMFGHSNQTALMISASLAQIGEFSFILASLGVGLGVLPEAGRDLILAGAMVSILLNPIGFMLLDRRKPQAAAPEAAPAKAEIDLVPTTLSDHAVVIGYGRVGSLVGAGLKDRGVPMVVIELRPDGVAAARRDGADVITGHAVDNDVLSAANLEAASQLFVTVPDGFEGGQIAEKARVLNPGLDIVARAHTDEQVDHLLRHGATRIIMGEREIAQGMLLHAANRAALDLAKAAESADAPAVPPDYDPMREGPIIDSVSPVDPPPGDQTQPEGDEAPRPGPAP